MNSDLFPALLAGPMIRRVDKSEVYIWLVTSKDFAISAKVYEIMVKDNSENYLKIASNTVKETIQFGESLFIHLVRIAPASDKFPTNRLIGYNLEFQTGHELFDLGNLGLLSHQNPHNIVYDSLKYPTFFIPEKGPRESAKFMFGSCRRSHGEGQDVFAKADSYLAQYSRNLSERTEALFLMGDQIYADNVADPLFPVINQFGNALIGIEEDLVSIDQRIENLFNTFDEAFESERFHLKLSRGTDKLKKLEKTQLQKRYNEHEKLIENCQSDTYKVRRLFANVPTYMIFDDHDITDDWNINANWKENVRKSPLGNHIVANGLSAYFAFQGWGNAPENFSEEFITKLTKYFKELRNGRMTYHEEWVGLLLEHQPWHYVAPTAPRALFLDTRTLREYDDKPNIVPLEQLISERAYPPQLVNESEYKAISKQLQKSSWQKGDPLIIISPTPVIGFDFIEKTSFNSYRH